MKLESVSIKRFRSIKSIEITNCGEFNVLIGKNNSGKSSILSAINDFFSCIQSGNIVTLNPPSAKEIDFFKRETKLPIEITLTFSLSLAERETLVQDIITEAPQMKNAVGGIEPSLQLSVSLHIIPPPNSFGFVSKLVLGGTTSPEARYPDPERVILIVSDEAASELYSKLSSYSQQNSDAEQLLQMLKRMHTSSRIRREWKEWKSESKLSVPFNFINFIITDSLSRPISTEIYGELEAKFDEASSYENFVDSVKTLAQRMKEEAVKVQQKPLKSKINTFTGEDYSIPNYAKNFLKKVSELKVIHLTERRKPIGEEEAERLLSLKVKRGGEEDLRNIKDTVSSLLGVRIDAFQGESKSAKLDKTAELDVDNFLVEVNGSGIKEALRLVLDVEFGHPDILLVEEPEIHLHPALETSMMRYLKRTSCNCQVFITTHSTNFLDTTEMNNVYLVSKPESTQVKLLDFEGAETQIPQELGIRLSSLFMFDRLVFVEGKSDEYILREWASKLGINFSQANVGFIAMGGVRNFAYFATEATLSFLTKRQVKMWFLVDRDEKEDSEVVNLKEALGQRAVLKILGKREIENYLICPRAVRELIRFKKESCGKISDSELPTESEIKQKIEGCAEQLKHFAIKKRVSKIVCKPVYPSEKTICEDVPETNFVSRVTSEIERIIKQLEEVKKTAEVVYKQKCNLIDSYWHTNKLAVVPGDLLLDMVCQEYGVHFKKEKDGSRLAAFMHAKEIDQEIIDIICEIAN